MDGLYNHSIHEMDKRNNYTQVFLPFVPCIIFTQTYGVPYHSIFSLLIQLSVVALFLLVNIYQLISIRGQKQLYLLNIIHKYVEIINAGLVGFVICSNTNTTKLFSYIIRK